MTSRVILSAIAIMVAISFCAIAQADNEAVVAQVATDTTTSTDSVDVADQSVVTYFHGDVRCATCKKLEAYSHEAIVEGFSDELKSGSLVWRTVNYDEDANKHYIDDYKLYTKALIVSKMSDSTEVGWVNLEKIWSLVGDKDEFVKYVQTETRNFMSPAAEPEAAEE
ncbi:MAG: nitrophenyl compound nitroreductase subunit ArsF family protein [bacterium]